MQALSLRPRASLTRLRRAGALLALFGLSVFSAQAPAAPPCPWIVQPSPEAAPGQKTRAPIFEIIFEGSAEEVGAFYAFSIASPDLAARLADVSRLPDLRAGARRLQPAQTALGTLAWRVAPDTLEPYVVYLAATRKPVDQLEAIGARIEPAGPLAISQLALRTRGASDLAGPLPHRSEPGYPIAVADSGAVPDLQICAYQVAMR